MPILFPKNDEGEVKLDNFPFDLSFTVGEFVIPVKGNVNSFQRLVRHIQRLKLERGILNQEEITDTHVQVTKTIRAYEQSQIQIDKQIAKNKLWEYHQVELLRLVEAVGLLVLTEKFFKFDEINLSLDLVSGDIEKIHIAKKYWDDLKNPKFFEKDEFSTTYPEIERIIDFPQYRKNVDKKPLEIMIGIIYSLKNKDLENLSLTKDFLKSAYDNNEMTATEYNEAIALTETNSFGIQIDKLNGILIQNFFDWRTNSLGGNTFRR